MPETPSLPTRPDSGPDPAVPAQATSLVSEIGALLQGLEYASATRAALPPVLTARADNQLIQVRLGVASSLYTALRLKHAATAGHSLRVALTCSAWAVQRDLPETARDEIEVAALLHDVGMIGVPDEILCKPGALDASERRIVDRARGMSLEILHTACAEPAILEIVEHVGAWYDGSKRDYRLRGSAIPVAARMITVAEAFDAMITDQVFRPALSVERATRELFEYAGTQFDAQLVRQFVEIHAGRQAEIHRREALRWLETLDPETAQAHWTLGGFSSRSPADSLDLFPTRLLESMHDGVIFVDAAFRVTQWNHGAERLTGVSGVSVHQRQWQPGLLKLRNERNDPIRDADCPVINAVRSGVQSLRRLTICGRSGREVVVDSHAIPVLADDGTSLGAILVLHDASPETSLEARCQSLHDKATRDALTQVANRAEFDRVQEAFIQQHRQHGIPCSLMICDLDRFKEVNDTYGHQAGDEAIKTLARLLKNSCRSGDLVARYGGEEFVMLCADCDNATATRRAEHVRKALSQTPQASLDGRAITASFGVTEIQPGDTPETMLHRADRALLLAKAEGRNRVIQLGVGCALERRDEQPGVVARKSSNPDLVIRQRLVTPVPVALAVEKLRGFVADHRANITSIRENEIRLEINDRQGPVRRRDDRPVAFVVDLRFEEEQVRRADADETAPVTVSRTRIHVSIAPSKNRDRRRDDIGARAREVLTSLRSYLMASAEDEAATEQGVLRRVSRLLGPWFTKP